VDPDETSHWRSSDARIVEVAASCGNDTSNEETEHHGAALHDWRAESFADDNRYEDEESQANVFGASPW
jgi:hypothetical protein